MKLIYTLYVTQKAYAESSHFCGFNSKEDLLDLFLLSVVSSSKHFDRCELYCNERALSLIKEDGRGFPFTKIVICHNELETWLMPHNWAYTKIHTYSLQEEPFVHIDCDVIICDGLPPQILKSKFIFQQKEITQWGDLYFYKTAFDDAVSLNILPKEIKKFPDFAFNMGLFGCLDKNFLPVLKSYCLSARNYIEQQQPLSDKLTDKNFQSVFFEQLLITGFLNQYEIEEGAGFETFLTDKSKNKFLPKYRYSHFVFKTKRKREIVYFIKQELIKLGLAKLPVKI